MEKIADIFLFLSGLLWATGLSSFSRYRPFDTTSLDDRHNLLRFIIDVVPSFS